MKFNVRKCFLVVFFIFSLNIAFAQHFNEKYGQPIVVLIETNPWLMVIGSDVPSFALYENGQIIFKRLEGNKYKYFETKNDRVKTQQIIKSLGVTDSLMKQGDYIEASNWTDQTTNILLLNFDTVRQISVYGNLRNKEGADRKKTPKAFLTVYDNILKFEDNTATEWLPDTIEVLATEYNYSPEKPLPWNTQWNDIKSPTSVKRSDNLYSIYLDRKNFKDFLLLIGSLKKKQAVEINGSKYSLEYRFPFPNLR